MACRIGFAHRYRPARALAAAALALALAGCFVPSGRKGEAAAQAQAAYAHCDEQRRAGKYATHLAAVDCAVPTVVGAYQGSGYSFADLVYISVEARRIGARKVDAGDVTEAEYQQDVAELETRLAAEDARRDGIMKYGGDPKPVAADTLLQGLNAFATPPTAAALPPPVPPRGAPPGCLPLGALGCK